MTFSPSPDVTDIVRRTGAVLKTCVFSQVDYALVVASAGSAAVMVVRANRRYASPASRKIHNVPPVPPSSQSDVGIAATDPTAAAVNHSGGASRPAPASGTVPRAPSRAPT